MLPGAFVSCLLGPGYWPWASEWAVHGHWTAPSKSSVIYVETLCPSSFVTTVGIFFFFWLFFAPDAVIMKCHRGNSSIVS